jgi:anaerobic magnesium-protoporphyrin IX monomethyl ester cyclase
MPLKILFVLPDIRPELHVHTGSVFEGVAYLSAFLKRDGHDVIKYQPTEPVSAKPLLQIIHHEEPDLIGFSVTTNMYKYVGRWAPEIKNEFPHIPTICGGVHATSDMEGVIATDGVDIACKGEGEAALRELCRRIEHGQPYYDIPSLWFKTPDGIVRNPVAPLPYVDQPYPLDNYPFPDLDLFNIEQTFYYKNRFAVMKLSRGCPLPCTYCCNKMFRDQYPATYVRYMSPESSIEHIQTYLRRYPNIDAIAFLDDILPMRMDWFREFARLYKQKIGIPYTARCLVNIVRPEVVETLAESGCYEVTFGVEAGDEAYRRDVLKRRQTDEKIVEAFQLCRQHGITTRANMMVGLPYEGMRDMIKGVKLCSKLNAKFFLVSTFFPTPSTELYQVCLKEGYIREGTMEDIPDSPYNMGSALEQPSVSVIQVEFVRKLFMPLVRLYEKLPERHHGALENLLCARWFPYRAFTAIASLFELADKYRSRLLLYIGSKNRRYEIAGPGSVGFLKLLKSPAVNINP